MSKIPQIVLGAQELQTVREQHAAALAAVPMPKVKMAKFPYESLKAAIKDDFKLLDGGADGAFALLIKGYKTTIWRKGAEKNRGVRDDLAEGKLPEAKKAKAKKDRNPVIEATVVEDPAVLLLTE